VVYYLRSSALGAVIAELNAQGTRTKEYVYAGGQRIAEWEITPFNDAINWQHRNPITGSWISISAGLNSAIRTEVDPSGRTTGNQPFVILEDPPEPVPNRRQDAYLIEGGATIEAELGMQLYEDRYINHVFGKGAGPEQGNYSGEGWRVWQITREFQLMTGQHFRLGIDPLNVDVPGVYELVKEEEQWDDGSLPYIDENGVLTVPSLRLVERSYYRLIPSQNPLTSTTNSQRKRLTKEQHETLRQDFSDLLAGREDCAEFFRRLLVTAAINTQRPLYNLSFIADPVTIFDAVAKQGGAVLDPMVKYGGSAEGDLGSDFRLPATMLFKSIYWGGLSWPRGEDVAHESAHFAPANGIFTDHELAWAGYDVLYSMGYTLKPPPSTTEITPNSEYFQFELMFKACNPSQRRK
jgi:hypothetical protein